MDDLKAAVNTLGFPKTAAKYIFSCEDDEEQLARCITIMGGVMHIMQTHFMTFYERGALIDELDQVTKLFQKGYKAEHPDTADEDSVPVNAIIAATTEMAKTIKDMHRKRLAPLAAEKNIDPLDHQSLLFRIGPLAKSFAIMMVAMLNDKEVIEAKSTGEPQKKLIDMVVMGLSKAYTAGAPKAQLRDVFSMHARAELRKAVEYTFKRRKLSL